MPGILRGNLDIDADKHFICGICLLDLGEENNVEGGEGNGGRFLHTPGWYVRPLLSPG